MEGRISRLHGRPLAIAQQDRQVVGIVTVAVGQAHLADRRSPRFPATRRGDLRSVSVAWVRRPCHNEGAVIPTAPLRSRLRFALFSRCS